MYNHFQSKTDLLIAYLDQFQENWYRSLENSCAHYRSQKTFACRIRLPHTKPAACGVLQVSFYKDQCEVGTEEPDVLKKVQKNKDTLRAYLGNMVAQVKHRNVLTNEALTEMRYLMMEGALVGAAIYKNADDLKRGRKIMDQLL